MFERLDAVVINLDRRPDRIGYIHQNIPFSYNPLHFMTNSFSTVSVSSNSPLTEQPSADNKDDEFVGRYRRFSAIDGKNLSEYYKSNVEFRGLLDTIRGKHRVLGEVGCSLSHFSLWNSHSKNPKADHLLVFEDDVMFTHDSRTRIQATMRDVQSLETVSAGSSDKNNNNWDVIYIGGQWTPDYDINSRNSYFNYQGTTTENLSAYYEKITTANCSTLYRRKNRKTAVIQGTGNVWFTPLFRTAGAYLVSSRGAKRLLEAIESDTALFMKTPLDMWLLEMDFRGYITIYDSLPHPFYQAGFELVKEPCHIQNDIHRSQHEIVEIK